MENFKWKKLGRIFNPSDLKNSWMKEYAQAPSVVVFDQFVRVYFSSRDLPDANGMYVSRLGYIDLDRNDLTKVINVSPEPILALGELGTFDEHGTYPASVIRTETEFRVYYAGWTRCVSVPFNAAIGVAISNDNGNTFSRIGKGPVLSFTPDEPFVLGSPKIRKFGNKWVLCYSSGRTWIANNGQPQPMYKIRMAISDDGINWNRIGKNLISDVLEENECQAGADILFRNGVYHMFFSYRYNLNFRDKGRGYQIGYAYSTNLLDWTRDDEKAGLKCSETGWDDESVSYAHVFELDSKTYMLHQGNEIGRYGLGLAIEETTN